MTPRFVSSSPLWIHYTLMQGTNSASRLIWQPFRQRYILVESFDGVFLDLSFRMDAQPRCIGPSRCARRQAMLLATVQQTRLTLLCEDLTLVQWKRARRVLCSELLGLVKPACGRCERYVPQSVSLADIDVSLSQDFERLGNPGWNWNNCIRRIRELEG